MHNIHPGIRERLNASCPALWVQASFGTQGWGVQFASYYSALSEALKHGNAMGFELSIFWNYGNNKAACTPAMLEGWQPDVNATGIECFFLPLHHCVGAKPEDGDIGHAVLSGTTNARWEYPWDGGNDPMALLEGMVTHFDAVQPPSFAIPLSSRGYEGHLAATMFCPAPRILSMAHRLQEEWGWTSKDDVLGIHIRQGDRVALGGIPTIEEYMEAIRKRVEELPDPVHVFLATDDVHPIVWPDKWGRNITVWQLPQGLWEPAVLTMEENIRDKLDKAMGESVPEGEQAYQRVGDTPLEVTERMLLEMELLSETNQLIGAQRSMFAWAASRIMIGKGKERACPVWVNNDISYRYGWWDAKEKDAVCV